MADLADHRYGYTQSDRLVYGVSIFGNSGRCFCNYQYTGNADYDSRSVKLTLVAGGIEKSFTVSQKQKDALTLTASRFEMGKEGGTVQVEVKANITFEVEIPEVDRSWISQANTRGLVATNLAFTVAPNEGVAGREGEIVIRSGSLSEKSGSRRREDVTTD